VTGLALGIAIGLITHSLWPPRLGWCSGRWAAGSRVGIARKRVPLPHEIQLSHHDVIRNRDSRRCLAEGVGFEPTTAQTGTTAFETALKRPRCRIKLKPACRENAGGMNLSRRVHATRPESSLRARLPRYARP